MLITNIAVIEHIIYTYILNSNYCILGKLILQSRRILLIEKLLLSQLIYLILPKSKYLICFNVNYYDNNGQCCIYGEICSLLYAIYVYIYNMMYIYLILIIITINAILMLIIQHM